MPASFSWPVTPAAAYVPSNPTAEDGAVDAGATSLRDEALDPLDGDLLLEQGDQVFLTGHDGVLSDVKARWQTVKTEWYLDTSIGVDWFGKVLVKNPNLGDIRAEFTREALKAPGVTAVQRFDMVFDRGARSLDVDFELVDDFGNIIKDSVTLTPGGTP